MTSSPDTPASSPVAPDSFSGAPIPGLSGHLVVAHVLDKLSDPTDLARVSAVSRGMRDAVAATGRTVMKPSEDEAVKPPSPSTVKHMHSRDRLSDTRLLCAAAACGDSSRVEGFAGAGEFSVGLAAVRGAGGSHLETLKWARERLPVGQEARTSDARTSKCCSWARENGCPWDGSHVLVGGSSSRPPRCAEVGARESPARGTSGRARARRWPATSGR